LLYKKVNQIILLMKISVLISLLFVILSVSLTHSIKLQNYSSSSLSLEKDQSTKKQDFIVSSEGSGPLQLNNAAGSAASENTNAASENTSAASENTSSSSENTSSSSENSSSSSENSSTSSDFTGSDISSNYSASVDNTDPVQEDDC
jgi:hypothetical protein